MGWEYRKLGQADQAAKAFAEELKLTPGNPTAMYDLGNAQVDSGQEKEALPLLQQVVKIYNHPHRSRLLPGQGIGRRG